MTLSKHRLGRLVVALAGLSAPLAGAEAALGDTMSATPGATPVPLASGTAYVLRHVDAGGTTINEYVATTSGIVFAYAWQGPAMPGLPALLGTHEASYRSGAAARLAAPRRGLHTARVEQPDVVVETSGRMRSYVGRAWLPDALPAGVTEGDLR